MKCKNYAGSFHHATFKGFGVGQHIETAVRHIPVRNILINTPSSNISSTCQVYSEVLKLPQSHQ